MEEDLENMDTQLDVNKQAKYTIGKYVVVPSEEFPGLYKITHGGKGGSLAKELMGNFNSHFAAKQRIDSYLSSK